MRIKLNIKGLLLMTGFSLVLSGCGSNDYNGAYYVNFYLLNQSGEPYIDKNTHEPIPNPEFPGYRKIKRVNYDSASPQIKQLRAANQKYCRELALKPENRISIDSFKVPVFNEFMYVDCLKSRGTPSF